MFHSIWDQWSNFKTINQFLLDPITADHNSWLKNPHITSYTWGPNPIPVKWFLQRKSPPWIFRSFSKGFPMAWDAHPVGFLRGGLGCHQWRSSNGRPPEFLEPLPQLEICYDGEIVDLPKKNWNMVIFHSYLAVYQRVHPPTSLFFGWLKPIITFFIPLNHVKSPWNPMKNNHSKNQGVGQLFFRGSEVLFIPNLRTWKIPTSYGMAHFSHEDGLKKCIAMLGYLVFSRFLLKRSRLRK